MVFVFDNLKYALQYEQFDLDTGDYGRFAEDLVSLMKIEKGSRVLDLGCGTGISTCKLFDRVENVEVRGIDKSGEFLEIALLKFGLLTYPERIFNEIKKDEFYPSLIQGRMKRRDLLSYLQTCSKKYRLFNTKLSFIEDDALSALLSEEENQFDAVFASQFIHWLRKKDSKPGIFNFEYETSVLQQVRNKLKPNGLFGFNTSGADFEFADFKMNEIKKINHPFYIAFKESLHFQLGLEKIQRHIYTFNKDEIYRIMKENGLEIVDFKQSIIKGNPNSLIETCLCGGHMQIFQSRNIDIAMEEREKILGEALNYALRKSLPESQPIFETGIHFVTKKIP